MACRFHDFAEDALENSLLTEQNTTALEKEIKSLRRKADNLLACNVGCRRLAYLWLMLKGWSGGVALGQGLAVVRKLPAVVPKGVQAELF